MTTTSRPPLRRSRPDRRLPWALEFYRSAVGKKWVMALTGIMLLGYVLVHMLGNLKVYIGPAEINEYGEALRELGGHLVPRTHLLWVLRIGLIGAAVLHLHAAYSLTRTNIAARGSRYSQRDYIAASYASRTMRWTGVIVAFFVLFHLADLTWGASPAAVGGWERGEVYSNLIQSFERPAVSALYIVANLALGLHIFHGTWSLFQSLGWSQPRFNPWRRYAAGAFTAVIVIGN
ncbi:succinate dehydrogenase cytochrome b subunit, partial [bacterium]|nr:succinate dehydrogenase cytochrome b subunit [bacterium]